MLVYGFAQQKACAGELIAKREKASENDWRLLVMRLRALGFFIEIEARRYKVI